jgi:alpha-L-fucosidase
MNPISKPDDNNPSPVLSSEWFTHDRFGLFIHWSLFSLAARNEWLRSTERLSSDDYQVYFEHFDPDLYDPRIWAQAAKKAGMRYSLLTTKHHEGFCLWDSAFTDYKATNTPARRDLVKMYTEAFREQGFKIGFYYSLLDWHHPEFPVDVYHPMRDSPHFHPSKMERNVRKYAEYVHKQVRELLTKYGDIALCWFDFSYPQIEYKGLPGKGKADWNADALLKLVRELQPGVLVNDRMGIGGDIYTPEEFQPRAWLQINGQPVRWETCQTMNGSWGYRSYNAPNWRSADELIRALIDTVSKGGNFLLNVGPNGRGELDANTLDRLRAIGEWMRLHNRSIYGCSASEFTPPPDCRYTQNGKRLYLHIFAYPYRQIHLPGLAARVEYAQFLHDSAEVQIHVPDPDWLALHPTDGVFEPGVLSLDLPLQKPDVAIPVIEIFLKWS